MSDIEILKEMIRDFGRVSLVSNQSRNKVILSEPPPANYSVTIEGMPDEENVIIIKSDQFKAPDTIFRGEHGECKRADFVIIANTSKKKVILCVEMKSASGKNDEILWQLQGAKCFAEYCKEIGKSFWKQPQFLADYEYRFLLIRNIRVQKQRSIIKLDGNSSSKIPMLVRQGSCLQFNDLIQCKQ